MTTWNAHRAGRHWTWNLPHYAKQHLPGQHHNATQIWVLQDSAMSGGNSTYEVQHKESNSHRFFYNENTVNDTMIIITRDLAERTQKLVHRQTKQCLMPKVYMRNDSMIVGNCHISMPWMPMKALKDEPKAMDQMLEEFKGGAQPHRDLHRRRLEREPHGGHQAGWKAQQRGGRARRDHLLLLGHVGRWGVGGEAQITRRRKAELHHQGRPQEGVRPDLHQNTQGSRPWRRSPWTGGRPRRATSSR